MKSIHLVIPDLFLPPDIAVEALQGQHLPYLQKLLGRGTHQHLDYAVPEVMLCELFGVEPADEAPVAPISAAFDGLGAGCWMRADPVHLFFERDRIMLGEVEPAMEEAAALCASLNDHFAGQGVVFFAPHPRRWYLKLESFPDIHTIPLSQAITSDMRSNLPHGADATYWHGVLNEVQMLLHAHPVNEARESRRLPPINSLWFWGSGCSTDAKPEPGFDAVCADDTLPEMLAAVARIPFRKLPLQWSDEQIDARQLLVLTGIRTALRQGDITVWRSAMQDLEQGYARPLWQALRSGRVQQLRLDATGSDRRLHVVLTRGDAWSFWRSVPPIARYSMV